MSEAFFFPLLFSVATPDPDALGVLRRESPSNQTLLGAHRVCACVSLTISVSGENCFAQDARRKAQTRDRTQCNDILVMSVSIRVRPCPTGFHRAFRHCSSLGTLRCGQRALYLVWNWSPPGGVLHNTSPRHDTHVFTLAMPGSCHWSKANQRYVCCVC